MSEIKDHLLSVRHRVEKACQAVSRSPEEVTLLAVSKTKPISLIEEAKAAGQRSFGENYVQELLSKYESLGSSVDWQMIGHLQRNKVKYIIDKVSLIHSVDTVPLALEIEKQAAKKDLTARILLEVNIAGEESKFGFTPEQAREAALQIRELPHVQLLGLMTSAPFTEEPETNRIHFRNLHLLAESLAADGLLDTEKPVLSMGMTGDFEVAVQEGATIVRIGTAIFGSR
ncbi:MAG: YggS family pyridoxal phosphate-dependent enzyme [Firmicutes bacterium]|nr:YggS family pyridoxal phosphate-dependent enzyme [Bacillota bacterium]